MTYKNIHYILKRNAKKNINITIKNDGTIMISAPKRVTISEINKVVEQKKDWIEEAKSKQSSKKAIYTSVDITDNSIIYFLGKKKRIVITPAYNNSIEIKQAHIVYNVKEKYIANQAYINSHFYILLKDILYEIVLEYLHKYLRKMHLEIKEFKLRNMTSRFGTCIPSKKEILFNTYLIHYPLEAIEYVVLHEISHLVHANHSANFYAIIEHNMPDWKNRRNLLKEYCLIKKT